MSARYGVLLFCTAIALASSTPREVLAPALRHHRGQAPGLRPARSTLEPAALVQALMAVAASGDDVAAIAFAPNRNARRLAAQTIAARLDVRAAALAGSALHTDARALLRDLAAALREYDLDAIDVLSARRAQLQTQLEGQLAAPSNTTRSAGR
jgi:hypothetical protein